MLTRRAQTPGTTPCPGGERLCIDDVGVSRVEGRFGSYTHQNDTPSLLLAVACLGTGSGQRPGLVPRFKASSSESIGRPGTQSVSSSCPPGQSAGRRRRPQGSLPSLSAPRPVRQNPHGDGNESEVKLCQDNRKYLIPEKFGMPES